PTSQGEVRKQANLVTRARREKVDFVATANQTQLVLQAGKRLDAERCGRGRSLVEQASVEVGAPDRNDLAVPDEAIECLERLLHRHVEVGGVQLKQIDPVGLQAAKAALGGGRNRLGACARRQRMPVTETEFGRDDDIV